MVVTYLKGPKILVKVQRVLSVTWRDKQVSDYFKFWIGFGRWTHNCSLGLPIKLRVTVVAHNGTRIGTLIWMRTSVPSG